MGWLSSSLITMIFTAHHAAAMPARHPGERADVTARCSDFVRVTRSVFTGRGGAWFAAGGQREYLGEDTFGPGVLSIGGVDPALYLRSACGGR